MSHAATRKAKTPPSPAVQLSKMGVEESFVPVAHAIQWVGTNLGQIQLWWVGIDMPAPRMYDRGDVQALGIWCNPSSGKQGYRLIHTTDWIVYWAGRVQILTALGYPSFKQGHREIGATSGVSEVR